MATASDDNKRCAQCTYVVLNIFPKMIQELLANTNETPQSIYHKVMKDHYFRKKQLNSTEMNTLQTLLTDGYTKLDVSFMYKITKHFRLIDPPTRDWNSYPSTDETELGDDIERIRRARNRLVHKFDANISEQEYRNFFEEITIVSRRLDTYLKKEKGMGYENKIQEYKLSYLDPKDEEKLLDQRKQEECFKQICKCTTVGRETDIHIYAGKTMNELIDKVKSIAGDYVVPINITIHGIDDSEDKVEMINRLKNELSTQNITIKGAEKSCIILLAWAKSKVLEDNSFFLMEIDHLIEKIVQTCNLTCKAGSRIYAVVTSAEEEFDHDELIEPEGGGPSLFGDDDSFILRVDIQNKSFASGETMEHAFSEFFDNIAEKENGQQLFGKKPVHAILIPERKADKYQFYSDFDELMPSKEKSSDEPEMTLSNKKEYTAYQGEESISYAQAQLPVRLSHQFSVILRQTILIEQSQSKGYLVDCLIIDDQLVFTDIFNNRLLIYNTDGSFKRHIQRSCKPKRLSRMKDHSVAVSYVERYIDIICLNTGKVESTIRTTVDTFGMAYQNGRYYVGIDQKRINVLDTAGIVIKSFRCPSGKIQYIASDRDSLYFPSHMAIYCYDLYGMVKWQFEYEQIRGSLGDMRRLCGITADGNGNVFVTYTESNKVLFVSTDGKDYKELLTRKDGLERPTGVSFDKSNKCLLVCNERHGRTFLYDIKDLTKGSLKGH